MWVLELNLGQLDLVVDVGKMSFEVKYFTALGSFHSENGIISGTKALPQPL